MKIINLFYVVFTMLSIYSPLSYAGDVEDFFQVSLGDYQEELLTSRDEGKKGVFIFFHMDECPFCHWMKTNVLNQTEVQNYFKKHFKSFAIDIEGDVEILDFKGQHTTEKDFSFKQHRVRATPVMAFFDLQGKRIVRYTGRTSSVGEFLLLGQFVVSNAYQKMKFSKYKRLNK